MRNLIYLITSVILTIFSCSNLNDELFNEEATTIKEVKDMGNSLSLIDPNTPIKAMPTIKSTGTLSKSSLNGPSGYWDLVWSDEFDGTTLNPSKWIKSVSTSSRSLNGRDPALKDWRWVEDHAFLDGNGELTLRASKKNMKTMKCGAIESKNLFEPLYGFIEVRMRVAETTKGNHTAFWLQGHHQGIVDGTANDGAEVDVFESAWINDTTKSVVHIDGYSTDHQANTKPWSAPNIHSGYHTYGLNWTPTKLEIYYDGVLKVQYTDSKWIPMVQEWIWLSVGASFADGDFGSQPIGILSDAKVDYVRVWAPTPIDPTVDYFRLVNKQTSKWIKTYGSVDDSYIKQSSLSSIGNWTTWKIQYTTPPYFYFVNEGTGKYFRPISNSEGSYIQLKSTSFNGSWSQWEMIDSNDGYVYIKNRETRKYLRPYSTNDDDYLILTSTNTENWEKWKLELAY
ncbi:family 16 glycosylhydrolase [Aestuariibaculum sediminum]|uniref:Family 16 glycosylhydrolase n=1 Tax=Aestuariibaculum sediminum TaxID=2770637 RepID=A0A8J6UE27_9FLAO|nr:family 16 glycosylhydrolase [Aestuariibaculum sediminum]MBD0833519.1 family 16 glycosylhydrolase [Aestuariibaculum sediminum]